MQASGILYLSKTRPLATVVADGTFCLTALAFDRQGVHQVEPWRLVWMGADAQAFWDAHLLDLKPGQPLYVNAHQMRIVQCHGRAPECVATVTLLYLEPTAQELRAAKATAQAEQAEPQAA